MAERNHSKLNIRQWFAVGMLTFALAACNDGNPSTWKEGGPLPTPAPPSSLLPKPSLDPKIFVLEDYVTV